MQITPTELSTQGIGITLIPIAGVRNERLMQLSSPVKINAIAVTPELSNQSKKSIAQPAGESSVKARSNDIKHKLRTRHQLTLKDFADQNGFKYRDVSDVSRGIRSGNYGVGREIIEKLTHLIGPLTPADSDR